MKYLVKVFSGGLGILKVGRTVGLVVNYAVNQKVRGMIRLFDEISKIKDLKVQGGRFGM